VMRPCKKMPLIRKRSKGTGRLLMSLLKSIKLVIKYLNQIYFKYTNINKFNYILKENYIYRYRYLEKVSCHRPGSGSELNEC
jgi:hypothetical protein